MSTLIQRSFAGGELAPSLHARVDSQKYQFALKTIRNYFVMRHGGASNRSGTQFVCEVSDSSKSVRLLDFVFNNNQTYIIEAGEGYMRFIQNGGQLVSSSLAITSISQADPCVITNGASVHTLGSFEVFVSGVLGMTELNNRNFKTTILSTTTFSIQTMAGTDVNSSGFGSYLSGGTAGIVYEISTPYVESQLSDLDYVQSADVVTIVHNDTPVYDLKRFGDTNWSIDLVTFQPEQQRPTGLNATGTGGALTFVYGVTAINDETFEESLVSSASFASLAAPTTSAPHSITWTTSGSATQYNVYEYLNGVPGFIGVGAGGSFSYGGSPEPDTTEGPPSFRNPFSSSGNYPGSVSYIQQRLALANTDDSPETVYTSKTGFFKNFTRSSPLQDDDAITFTMAGRQVNSINYVLDLGQLVILTSAGEWTASGAGSGALKPTDVNLKQHSYNGSAKLRPIVINGSALYVQNRGSIIRDIGFDFEIDGYRGNDLTIFSAHLFDGFTILDWAYQKTPHSIVWAVRSDGILLALTYVREQQLIAWSRHDIEGGFVENINVIPEGNEDAVYLVVRREVSGRTVRYIERLTQRFIDDIKDVKLMDSHLSYDGRNKNPSNTMTISSGSTWEYTETLSVVSNAPLFSDSYLNREIHITASTSIVRFNVEAIVSSTVVTGLSNRTVPTHMRNVDISSYSIAIKEVDGLWHIDGNSVSVFADGFVVASPYNPSYTAVTVASGAITLDKAYSVIHVGLPVVSDIETLDIDTAQGETIADKKKHVGKVGFHVEKSRGFFVGPEMPDLSDGDGYLSGLTETKLRNSEGYDDPIRLIDGVIDVNIEPQWSCGGHVFIRQVDPIPTTILSIIPSGNFPFRG